MEIQEWLDNKGTYAKGIELYNATGKANRRLLTAFQKKESAYNKAKLKAELKKLASKIVSTKAPKPKTQVANSQQPKPNNQQPKAKSQETNQQPYTGLQAHQVPKELRAVYLHQKQLFLKVCFLHNDLKVLAPEQEVESLDLCLQIEDIWDEIDLIWYQLDYYRDTNIVLQPKVEDFSNLTDAQILQRRNNTRANLTKHEKAYTTLAENPPQTDSLAINKKYNDKLRKKETTILNNKNMLLALNKLIDKR